MKKIRTKSKDVQVTLVLGVGNEIVVDGSNEGGVELTDEQFKVLEGQIKGWSKYLEVIEGVERKVEEVEVSSKAKKKVK